jgi:hypothetical protein
MAPVAVLTEVRSEYSSNVSRGFVAVSSVHVQASVDDINSWFKVSTLAFQDASVISNSRHIIGGDFNHNLTDQVEMPLGWRLDYANDINSPLSGTSQKEFNWMGNFDGFWLSNSFVGTTVKLIESGFMPKVVAGLPQGGVIRSVAQFTCCDDGSSDECCTLDKNILFSSTSQSPFTVVSDSSPISEALSDHLIAFLQLT